MSQKKFNVIPFSEWIKIRESRNDGKANSPEEMSKISHKEKKSGSCRESGAEDLSGDYVGHVKKGGDKQQHKVLKGKGQKGPVAK